MYMLIRTALSIAIAITCFICSALQNGDHALMGCGFGVLILNELMRIVDGMKVGA